MKEVQVRCWKVKCFNKSDNTWEDHIISYPDGFGGHTLITCIKCGKIYAISVINELYNDLDVKTKLNQIKCIECGVNLGENFAEYPETFVGNGGSIEHFVRDSIIPEDKYSLILSFPEIS